MGLPLQRHRELRTITTGNGDLAIIYGPLNGGRLPTYHRLDLGVTKTWKLDEHQVVQAGHQLDQRLRPREHLLLRPRNRSNG
jgi:hypothetical protein